MLFVEVGQCSCGRNCGLISQARQPGACKTYTKVNLANSLSKARLTC